MSILNMTANNPENGTNLSCVVTEIYSINHLQAETQKDENRSVSINGTLSEYVTHPSHFLLN